MADDNEFLEEIKAALWVNEGVTEANTVVLDAVIATLLRAIPSHGASLREMLHLAIDSRQDSLAQLHPAVQHVFQARFDSVLKLIEALKPA